MKNIGTTLSIVTVLFASLTGCIGTDLADSEMGEGEGAVEGQAGNEPGNNDEQSDLRNEEVTGEASAALTTTQKHNGVTCNNSVSGKTGSTRCTGNSAVKWRLRVYCSWQGDYTGPWNYGKGSDSFTCNRSVQGANVVWGN